MTWEGSIMLSHALTFSLSAFTPSSTCRQAGTEMQEAAEKIAACHPLWHWTEAFASQSFTQANAFRWQMSMTLRFCRQYWWHSRHTSTPRKTFIVSSGSWMKSLVHTTQALYHKSIFLDPQNIFKTWFVKLSNIYNEWLPETIISFPFFAGDFWVSANTSLW